LTALDPRSGAYTVYTLVCVYRENRAAGPYSVYAVYTVNTITMRICVTCASNSPVIDEIYTYCQLNGIVMCPGPYIYVDDSYWTWRIESELNSRLTWLLLKYPQELCVY
jgi:hypothetical protein